MELARKNVVHRVVLAVWLRSLGHRPGPSIPDGLLLFLSVYVVHCTTRAECVGNLKRQTRQRIAHNVRWEGNSR